MKPCHWFVFKVVSRCNLACRYCYMYFRGDESYRDRAVFVAPEVVDALAVRLKTYQARHGLEALHVIFHGGEPLMLGKERFERYARTLIEVCGPSLTLSVQTNGLLLDDEWIRIFSECDISVGISLDGPEAINDRHRVYKNGRGSFSRVRDAVELVRTAAERKAVKFGGIISVIDPDQSARDFYYFITRDLKVKTFNVLLPDVNHDNFSTYVPHSLTAFSTFLNELFDTWWADDPEHVTIPFFESVLRKIVIDRTMSEAIGAFGAPSIIIETDGSIQAHDVLRMNSPRHRYVANVLENEINELFDDQVYRAVNVRSDTAQVNDVCGSCPVFHICQGGFIAHRFSAARGYDNPSVYCDALFDVISHAYFVLQDEERLARVPPNPERALLAGA